MVAMAELPARAEVRLYGMTVGHLVGASWRDFDVRITDEAIERFGIGSTILSQSIPLVPQPQPDLSERFTAHINQHLR